MRGKPFDKGNPGRPAGTPNKVTTAAKEAFALAFDKLGGIEGLVRWANADPDNLKVFYTLYARLIPVDHTSGGEKIPSVNINVPPLPDGRPER